MVDQIADLFRGQHTKWKHNRCLGTRVSDVGTSSWLVTSRMRWIRCLWYWISTSTTKDLEDYGRSDPSINGRMDYPNDLDGPLNEVTAEKIRQYHTDYNNLSFTVTTLHGIKHPYFRCFPTHCFNVTLCLCFTVFIFNWIKKRKPRVKNVTLKLWRVRKTLK